MYDERVSRSTGSPASAGFPRERRPVLRVPGDTIAHRRRRAAALIIVALLSLIAGIAVGSSPGSHPGRTPVAFHASAGYFARIHALAGSGNGSFEGDELADENAAINRTLAYTPYVRIAGSEKREMALTFDDGPGPYTPAVLAALERAHAPATFFEVGFMLQYFHASTTAIVDMGDPIGDHTQLHRPMNALSLSDQRNELLDQAAVISESGAPFPRLFRPPYGVFNASTLTLLHKYGMLMVMWTIDSDDYLRPGVDAIVHTVVSGARPGAIVLLHDAGGDRSQTVAALPVIISELRARGYKLVTVPRLLLDDPPPRVQNVFPSATLGGS